MTEKKDKIIKVNKSALIPNPNRIRALAEDFQKSGMFSGISSLPGYITVIEYGRELGIPPVAALQTFSIVRGKICAEAKVLRALFIDSGGDIEAVETTDKICKLKFTKKDRKPFEYTYTIEEAQREGYLTKDNWKKMPKLMLFERCSSRGIRAFDPRVVMGLYSVEEIVDAIPAKYTEKAPPAEQVIQDIYPGENEGIFSKSEIKQAEKVTGKKFTKEKEEQLSLTQEQPIEDSNDSKKIGRSIHLALSKEGLSAKEKEVFMQYLYEIQEARGRKYVDKGDDGKLHFSLGGLIDLKLLRDKLSLAISKWRENNERNKI